MSASSRPTRSPVAASTTARLTVAEGLPPPPLPLAIANTLVSEPGLANGISFSAVPPRSRPCSSRRCSSLITSSSPRTPVTPPSLLTAAVTSLVIVSRSGQPATVSQTCTNTVPSEDTSTCLTMPSSVIGRWISGSLTPARAWVTCSMVGAPLPPLPLDIAPCYGCAVPAPASAAVAAIQGEPAQPAVLPPGLRRVRDYWLPGAGRPPGECRGRPPQAGGWREDSHAEPRCGPAGAGRRDRRRITLSARQRAVDPAPRGVRAAGIHRTGYPAPG